MPLPRGYISSYILNTLCTPCILNYMLQNVKMTLHSTLLSSPDASTWEVYLILNFKHTALHILKIHWAIYVDYFVLSLFLFHVVVVDLSLYIHNYRWTTTKFNSNNNNNRNKKINLHKLFNLFLLIILVVTV